MSTAATNHMPTQHDAAVLIGRVAQQMIRQIDEDAEADWHHSEMIRQIDEDAEAEP
jgi:hypothetical protein